MQPQNGIGLHIFIKKNLIFFSGVFHIITSHSTYPNIELKGEDKKTNINSNTTNNNNTGRDGLHSGEVHNGSSLQGRRPASFITQKVTLSASNRGHFRATAEPTGEWEPGGYVC
ncbi:hypothetical protein CHARACLAT_024764 [Characodon lateralis]|uniref:Uncharacterized protein n=1 Tax=Characodon lateralis TaxID=208331 RepID=A0ABU7DA98_9TELE|nr:hypothetical protein [Characodon lateralis]